jgi:hypothetical protein
VEANEAAAAAMSRLAEQPWWKGLPPRERALLFSAIAPHLALHPVTLTRWSPEWAANGRARNTPMGSEGRGERPGKEVEVPEWAAGAAAGGVRRTVRGCEERGARAVGAARMDPKLEDGPDPDADLEIDSMPDSDAVPNIERGPVPDAEPRLARPNSEIGSIRVHESWFNQLGIHSPALREAAWCCLPACRAALGHAAAAPKPEHRGLFLAELLDTVDVMWREAAAGEYNAGGGGWASGLDTGGGSWVAHGAVGGGGGGNAGGGGGGAKGVSGDVGDGGGVSGAPVEALAWLLLASCPNGGLGFELSTPEGR